MKRCHLLLLFALTLVFLYMGCNSTIEPYTLGGQVLLQDFSPLEGIEVSYFWPDDDVYGGGPKIIYTDIAGWYSYRYGFPDERVTITPSSPAYIFSPTKYEFQEVHADHLDLDFIAIPLN
jgi:hypothetical protein